MANKIQQFQGPLPAGTTPEEEKAFRETGRKPILTPQPGIAAGPSGLVKEIQTLQKQFKQSQDLQIEPTPVEVEMDRKIVPITAEQAEKVKEFGIGALQSMARGFIAFSQEAVNVVTRQYAGKPFVPVEEWEKKLFGTDQPINFESIGRETAEIFGKGEEIDYENAAKLGLFMAAIDIIPFGGPAKKIALKQAAKLIAKRADPGDVIKVLRKTVTGDEAAIKSLAKGLAKETDAKKIEDILKKVQEISAKKVTVPRKPLAKEVIPAKKVIPAKVTPKLVAEARGFATADEFVEAQQTYLFHGTNEEVLDSIVKDGLKPLRRGLLSLSKDETFAKSFARSGITPQGKTKAVMLRVKKDLLKGKTVSTDKPRPMVDHLHEILTKETIPPEVLEVSLDNGKIWKNLITGELAKTKSQLTDIFNQAKGVARPTEVARGARERGYITSAREAVPELRVAGQYIPRSTDDLAIKARNLITSNIETAERFALEGTDDMAVATASELVKHYAKLAEKATGAEKIAFYDKAASIVNTIAERLTEQGRAIQAASILSRLTPEGHLRFAAREIQKYNVDVEEIRGGILGLKKKLPELTGKQTEELMKKAKELQEMPDGVDKAIAFKKLQDSISDLIPSPWYNKIVNVWKAGLLTGLKTSGLNTLSNLSHGIQEVIKDVPAVAVDSVASLFTGKRTIVFTLRGAKGTREGFGKGLRYIKTGFDERNVGVKLDWKRVNFGKSKVARALQAYEQSVFRVIGGQDQPFYYGAKAHSLASQAMAQAKNSGLKLRSAEGKKFVQDLIENPTDDMLRYATNDAEISVFQNKTVLSEKIGKAIQRLPGGEIILPFNRTPSSVAMQIINYSPVGIVNTIVRNIGKGRFDQRLFSQGIARGVTGTGVMWMGMELYKRGRVSLDYPTTERERNQWKLEGRKPNAIKIGNKWRSILVLGPPGMVIILGGHLEKFIQETGSLAAALPGAAFASLKSFKEQTFLVGINQFSNALNEPERYAENVVGRTVGSFIPTIISDAARAIDVFERRSYVRTEGFFAPLRARIPGIRQTLEPQIDVLGSPILSAGNAYEIMLDPTRPTNIKSSEVIKELRRLFDADFPATPTRFADEKKFTKTLSPEQITYIQEKAGMMLEDKLGRLFKNPKYIKADDDAKKKKIDEYTNESRFRARVEMVGMLLEDLSTEEKKAKLKELKEIGFMTEKIYEKWKQVFPEQRREIKDMTTGERRPGLVEREAGLLPETLRQFPGALKETTLSALGTAKRFIEPTSMEERERIREEGGRFARGALAAEELGEATMAGLPPAGFAIGTAARIAGRGAKPIAKGFQLIAKEARKYKTADEFVKAQSDALLAAREELARNVPIDSIKPTQFGEDLFNETSRGYAEGFISRFLKPEGMGREIPVHVGKLKVPEQLPAIVVDDSGKIIDGNNRWAAAKIAGLKEIKVVTKSQLTAIFNQAKGAVGTRPAVAAAPVFKGFEDLTTKVLNRLKGKSTTSKQEITDLAKMADLKESESKLITRIADEFEGKTIPVQEFANKVKTELLPLKIKFEGVGHEGTTLLPEIRGNVANYSEFVYESPIKVDLTNVLHGQLTQNRNYFAHTRVEDMGRRIQTSVPSQFERGKNIEVFTKDPSETRRVIELQSDLFQKGRLEGDIRKSQELVELQKRTLERQKDPNFISGLRADDKGLALVQKEFNEITSLRPFRNTWHERIIREEVKRAAKDGKTKLQIPTGKTAMQIEGLGEVTSWVDEFGSVLKAQDLKVGEEIVQGTAERVSPLADSWIITDVLGEGKFKAVPKQVHDTPFPPPDLLEGRTETFDISGKIDTNNPIYKFYEGDIGKYLQNKYGAKRMIDEQGVEWWEIDVPKEAAKEPIEAFGVAPLIPLAAEREKEELKQ